MEEKFEYNYVSLGESERKRIENIRRRYETAMESEDKIQRVKQLDGRVKNTATVWALTIGIVGCLIFGTGMAIIIEWNEMLWGVVVSAIGCAPMLLAYPSHNFFLARGKKKYGDEILRLTDEILHKK